MQPRRDGRSAAADHPADRVRLRTRRKRRRRARRALSPDDNAGTTAGTKATVWQCGSNNTHRQFTLYPDGTIRSLDSGLCLDVYNGTTTSGSRLDPWTCTGSSNQQWTR